MLIRYIIYISAFLFVVGAIIVMADERNFKVVFERVGRISSGSAMGVNIGDSTHHAIATLEDAGWEHFDRKQEARCPADSTVVFDEVNFFVESSWRRGVVCVGSQAGAVSTVGWGFKPGSP